MEIEMTEKQKEIFDRLMAIPVMEWDLNDDLSPDILVRWIVDLSETAGKINNLMESPEISMETVEFLEKDLERLKVKFDLVAARFQKELK